MPETLELIMPNCTSIGYMFNGASSYLFGVKHLTITLDPAKMVEFNFFMQNNEDMIDVTFTNGVKIGGYSNSQFVGYNTNLEAIYGEIDFSECEGLAGYSWRSGKLRHVRFKPNTLKVNLSNNYSDWDKATLISLANCLDATASKKLTLKPAYKTTLSSTYGIINGDALFEETGINTDMVLMDFITQVKGWTVA